MGVLRTEAEGALLAMTRNMQADAKASSRPRWRQALAWAWRHPRYGPMTILLACFVLGFGLQRAILAGLNWHYLRDSSAGELARVFLVGMRYDLRAWGYVCIPLLPPLMLLPASAFARRWVQAVIRGYLATVLTLLVAVNVVDALFFRSFSERMNSLVPNYVGNPEVAWHLWNHYPVVALVLIPVVALAGTYWLLGRLTRDTLPVPARSWRPLVVLAVLIAGVFLATNRRPEKPVLDSSLAYFSSNNIMSELSLNSGCTLASALQDYIAEGQNGELHYPAMKDADAFAAAWEALAEADASPAREPANPLWRTVDTRRPRRDLNVVVVVMEGFAGQGVGALGHENSQTPFFDSFAARGLYFSQMFAAGQRTSRGLSAVLCGLPDLGGPSILERPAGANGVFSLPTAMAERGYRTMFFYGGDGRFDNMRAFFTANGVQRFCDIADMPAGAWRTHWGVADHTLFDEVIGRLDAHDDGPFFATVLTLTHHQPYEVPPGCIKTVAGDDLADKMSNTLRYADWALRRFFERAAESEWFDDTVFVLAADHGLFVSLSSDRFTFDPTRLVDVDAYRVPCLIYSPALPALAGARVDIPCSQTDIAPTLLGLLGGQYGHCFLGRDMLGIEPDDTGWALLRAERRMALVQGNLTLVLPPDSPAVLFRRLPGGGLAQLPLAENAAGVKRMQRRTLGLLYSANHLCREQAFRDPRKASVARADSR